METINLITAIIALIVALLGGIPGILEVVKYFENRTKLSFQLAGSMHGDWINSTSMIMITGTLSNASEKPIVPSYFDLDILLNDKWVRLSRINISKDVKFSSQVQQIEFENPWMYDLQNIKTVINNSTPAYGHLMFLIKNFSRTDFISVAEFKLTCTDIQDRKFENEVSS